MHLIQSTVEGAIVLLTQRELTILANAINETLQEVEDWEFSTRVGVEPAEADILRRKIVETLTTIERSALPK